MQYRYKAVTGRVAVAEGAFRVFITPSTVVGLLSA